MNTKKIAIVLGSVILADYLFAKINTKPTFFVREKLPFNYNAQTVPPFGIFIKKEHENNQKLIEHELHHWQQYNKMGSFLFLSKYLLQLGYYGYDKMPLEIDARIATGENPICIENYTECVKNGLSNTVKNPTFRNV